MTTSKRTNKHKRKNAGKRSRKEVTRGKFISFLGAFVVLFGSGLALALTMPAARIGFADDRFPPALKNQYANLARNVTTFEKREDSLKSELVSDQVLKNMLSQVQLDAASGNYVQSKKDMISTQTSLNNWNLELSGGSAPGEPTMADSSLPADTAAAGTSSEGVFLPVVLYHYTPPDFEQQLEYLVANNYTAITMDQALAGLNGGPLPPKPVVITFDDGYENQMQAFALLEQFHMKATFYIINGGPESLWCIGAGRQYHLSIQPKGGCGDAYLTWDQVRQLDKSGLITIGGHTIDHENLASLSTADQQYEIDASKTGIEQEIGHTIDDFAYPYGAYNDTTIQLVQAAGYRTAVTTLPSNYQIPGEPYTFRRIRDTETLP
ncbi:MAG TPA: polysaccharide deacetylase family protein [Candidatus Saccharimonadia bacterium]|nr:polysaccharide deacetylase family protein [Candidatus Saccharimonadia bacterium]